MSTVNKIVSREEALKKVREWKSRGKKIVFSNGCFDIVHAGHVDYLEKARTKGDKLVLGINTDSSVTRLKGKDRPVFNEKYRAQVMAAFEFIDLVVPFEEDTPMELIRLLIPDVLVKGKDYDIKNIVGADFVMQHGGKVETIELTEGLSTSYIIERIKSLD